MTYSSLDFNIKIKTLFTKKQKTKYKTGCLWLNIFENISFLYKYIKKSIHNLIWPMNICQNEKNIIHITFNMLNINDNYGR